MKLWKQHGRFERHSLILVIGIFPNLVFRVTDGEMTSVAQSIASAVGG